MWMKKQIFLTGKGRVMETSLISINSKNKFKKNMEILPSPERGA